MTPEQLARAYNTKLAAWGDRSCADIIALITRGLLPLKPGTQTVPDILKAQLRVVIGFAIREAALAGQQLQARIQNPQADAAVMREDKPLLGVTATARRVTSDLRPREHVTQRFPAVVPEQAWDEETTEVMRQRKNVMELPKLPDLGDD